MSGALTRCVQCGKAEPPAAGVVTETRTVGGVTFTAELPAAICAACGESYMDGEVLGRFERAIAAELGRLGQRSPEAFKFMRKAIGFKANALAELLDVTPETVSRWENGGLPVEPRAFALLGATAAEALEGRDATLLRLRALLSPLKVTQPVHVKVA